MNQQIIKESKFNNVKFDKIIPYLLEENASNRS